jgi:hypothetical protein
VPDDLVAAALSQLEELWVPGQAKHWEVMAASLVYS